MIKKPTENFTFRSVLFYECLYYLLSLLRYFPFYVFSLNVAAFPAMGSPVNCRVIL